MNNERAYDELLTEDLMIKAHCGFDLKPRL